MKKYRLEITSDGAKTAAYICENGNIIKTETIEHSPEVDFGFEMEAREIFESLFRKNYLKCCGEHCGTIGEPTNYKDAVNRPLYIGDVVELFGKYGDSYGNEIVVKGNLRAGITKTFVNGIENSCDEEKGTTGAWKILKKRSYEDVKNGEIISGVEYVKS